MYINIVFSSVSVFTLNIAFSFLKGEKKKQKKPFKFTRRKKQIISLLFIVCHIYMHV